MSRQALYAIIIILLIAIGILVIRSGNLSTQTTQVTPSPSATSTAVPSTMPTSSSPTVSISPTISTTVSPTKTRLTPSPTY